jgi:phosphatidate cytidylyltransferase
MLPRILTGLILAPLVVVLFLWGPDWSLGLFWQVVAVIGGLELFRLLFGAPLASRHRLTLVLGLALPAAAFLDAYFLDGRLWPLLLVLFCLTAWVAKLFSPEPIERANDELGRLTLGLAYGGLLWVFPMLLSAEHRPWVLLTAAAVWGGDTGAYFAGRALGRHKLYPAISPKKTVEGSIGGLLGSAGMALLFRWVGAFVWGADTPALWHVLAFATVAGVVEQIGDLVESLLKRSAGVKDSGTLLPGHGGVLDRFDGFLLAAPVVYVLVELASGGHG